MAALWNILRQEVRATVDDFREKGALGALKDAALDTRDMATSLGGGLINGVKDFVADAGREDEPVLQVLSFPVRGTVAPLRFCDGTTVQATVVEIDTVSDPPRAKVAAPGLARILVVRLAIGTDEPTTPQEQAEEHSVESSDASLIDLFAEECRETVNEFREKGAVGAVRDAALDTYEIVGSTASKAVNGARSLAAPLIVEAASTSTEAAAASSTVPESGAAVSNESVNLLDLPLFDSIKQEWTNTVQEFREKGAVEAVKDAALDAADLVGSTAKGAVNGARSLVTSTVNSSSIEELRTTAQDFRAKETIEAVRVAAYDAADRVSSSATTVFHEARSIGSSLLSAVESPVQQGADVLVASEAVSAPPSAELAPESSPSSSSEAADRPQQEFNPPERAKEFAADIPNSARKSLVAMRRACFEKSDPEPPTEEVPIKEVEELID